MLELISTTSSRAERVVIRNNVVRAERVVIFPHSRKSFAVFLFPLRGGILFFEYGKGFSSVRTSATRRRYDEKRSCRLYVIRVSCKCWSFETAPLGIRLGLFPLGLRAPKCLGACVVCFANARLCLGGGRNPPPSFGTPPRSSFWSLRLPRIFIFF